MELVLETVVQLVLEVGLVLELVCDGNWCPVLEIRPLPDRHLNLTSKNRTFVVVTW